MREQRECMVLSLGTDEEPAESLWVRIRGQINMGNVVVVVYCRPPDWEEADEAFFRQLEEAR